MRICRQWFDETIRARIAERVQQVPDLSRIALAKRVCEWLGWQDARGQPQLGVTRKALAELDRRGVIRLPTPAARPVRSTSAEPVDSVSYRQRLHVTSNG